MLFSVSGANLDEVSSAAVDADVRQLQADDLTGLSDDESRTGQLWPRRHKGEVAVGGQHVQASYENTHTHITLEPDFSSHITTCLNPTTP